MKNIVRSFYSAIMLSVCLFTFSNCSSDDDNGSGGGDAKNGITTINNETEKSISLNGETVDVSFTATGKWTPELKYSSGSDWATVSSISGNTAAGKGSFKVLVSKNGSGKERVLTINVKVDGFNAPATVCTVTQTSEGQTSADLELNEYMDKFLKKQYLFNEEYNTLSIDYGAVSYEEFLSTNLLKLQTNKEDGGIFREFSANSGKRYIYSYIADLGTQPIASMKTTTRGTSVVGTGLGTFFSSYMEDQITIGLSIGYVYINSPAEKAGLQRGDVIVSVNGTKLVKSNYQQYSSILYSAGGGETFDIGYKRQVLDKLLNRYTLVDGTTKITTGAYSNSPILYSMYITNKAETMNIGYVAYLAFDMNFTEDIKFVMEDFKSKGITDLILDLRFNNGGAVELARYISACIAGPAHKKDVFMKLERNSGKIEEWQFGDGVDLGLKSVRIICSEETASASELVISGLRGIDFPVKLFGSLTEGKNVGMEVQSYKCIANGRNYEFAPITFRSFNAKNWGDYANGITPDVIMNNQNSSYDDDIDNVLPYAFGNWDNFDFNKPLWWALCDIQGVDPTTGQPVLSSGKAKLTRSANSERIIPVPSVPMKRPNGTFGSLIYNTETVEIPN